MKGGGVMPLYGKWVCLWPYMVPYFPPWVFGLNKIPHSLLLLYNYGLHEKLISIIIKLRKGYFPEVRISIIIKLRKGYFPEVRRIDGK